MTRFCRWCALGVAILAWGLVFTTPVGAQQAEDEEHLASEFRRLADAGNYADAIPFGLRVVALREKALGTEHPDVATALNAVAIAYDELNRYDEAEPMHKHSLAIREKTLGPDHLDVAKSLGDLGGMYLRQDRLSEAEPLLKRSIAIREKALGPDHADLATVLNQLGRVYRDQFRFSEAEPLYNRSIAIREKELGPHHVDVATSIINLARLYEAQHRYGEAEPHYKRGLAIREASLGPDHPKVASTLQDLAELYEAQGRYGEAEILAKRGLAIQEKVNGPDHEDVAVALNRLASIYQSQGRYSEAERLLKRDLAISEKAQPADNHALAAALNNLASLYVVQNRYDEAEPPMRRALALLEKASGPEHPDVASALNNLAALYNGQNRFSEAEPLLERSLAIREKVLGTGHPDLIYTLNSLAIFHERQGRYDQAEALVKRALAISEKALGTENPAAATLVNNLAWLAVAKGEFALAANYGRRSTALVRQLAERGISSATGQSLTDLVERHSDYFESLVKVTFRVTPTSREERMRQAGEMLEAAQWADLSEAAASLAKTTARTASGSTELAGLVRERQDLVVEWQAKDKRLISARSAAPDRRNADSEKALGDHLAAIDRRLAGVDARLAKEFPAYAALAQPRPATVADVQAHLGPEGALLLFLDTRAHKSLPEESFIWVITKTDVLWFRAELGTKALEEKVAKLRRSLDPTAGGVRAALPVGASAVRPNEAFDVALAHELYAALLAPAADLLRDKTHLMIVPSGPLTALPFHVLVTEPSAAQKEAAWLIRRHAITTLPSVASLATLRRTSAVQPAPKPFLAFADPVFRRGAAQVASADPTTNAPEVRGVSTFFRGSIANLESLAGLAPLPESADEVRAIAATLRDGAELRIGAAATETEIKRMRLDEFRVVHFATHGLVAGEIKGLAEPALALSAPAEATPEDDGLLTASEVADLKLNAEWVILSACNTAAGDRPGAEALSGLARAFFYAGTKALLVSHWPVRSAAAVALTTRAFAELKRDPKIGRAEALRHAMLAMIDSGNALDVHPASWAPFVVVGEGGAGR